MKRSLLLFGVLLVPAIALAQMTAPSSPTATRGGTSLAAPPPPTPAQPVPPVQPTRPVPQTLPAPRQTPRPAVSPPAGPIRSTGPAQVMPAPRTTAPTKVYDRDGRIIPGVQQAGPNRVFDSRTGRYHDSVPQGGDSRINP